MATTTLNVVQDTLIQGLNKATGDSISINMNGNIIKNLSSGSDVFSVRPLFSNSIIELPFTSRILIASNEEFDIQPLNAIQNLDRFWMPYQFVLNGNETETLYKKHKDPTIKRKITTEHWKDAIVHIILDGYKDTFIPNTYIEQETMELYDGGESKLNDFLNETFDFVDDINSKLTIKSVNELTKSILKQEKLSRQKLKKELVHSRGSWGVRCSEVNDD